MNAMSMEEVLASLRAELDREKVLITISLNRQWAIHRAIEALEQLGDPGPVMSARDTSRAVTAGPPVRAPTKPAQKQIREKRKPGPKVNIDYVEVAKVYRDAVAAGERAPVAVLMERFGVNRSTAKNWPPVCRKLGLLDPPKRFTAEPITRAPFDPQKTRDEQAGPPMGRPPNFHPTPDRPMTAPAPAAPQRPVFTPDMAREAIEQAAVG